MVKENNEILDLGQQADGKKENKVVVFRKPFERENKLLRGLKGAKENMKNIEGGAGYEGVIFQRRRKKSLGKKNREKARVEEEAKVKSKQRGIHQLPSYMK